jgi:hypothetical protein
MERCRSSCTVGFMGNKKYNVKFAKSVGLVSP